MNICTLRAELLVTNSNDVNHGKFLSLATIPGRAETLVHQGRMYKVVDVVHACDDPSYGQELPRHIITLVLEPK